MTIPKASLCGLRAAPNPTWYFAVENKVHVHDPHDTILHLVGIDHKRLTFRHSGRDMRLTEAHGSGVKEVLA